MSREFIYCPEVNPQSFVFLHTRGNSGASWSIRDYSNSNRVSVRYAREFPVSLPNLLRSSVFRLPATTRSTADLDFWHRKTIELNAQHLPIDLAKLPVSSPSSPNAENHYPILNREKLLALPKAAKTSDMKRILTSPNSEDWVTWNVFSLIRQTAPNSWWSSLADLAREQNPNLTLAKDWEQVPEVSLWRCSKPPSAYQDASRKRMAGSTHEPWILRAKSVAPVEGESEIDISLRNSALTLFIEAKLGSDVSLKTTYDPSRNQIARNIDCLLEETGQAQPVFWMLVRDRGSMRAYTQLMKTYRENPSTLAADLPHRDLRRLQNVASTLAVILWSDLIAKCCSAPLSSPLAEVHLELQRRLLS